MADYHRDRPLSWQTEYAARGIATFPFLSNIEDKRPLVKGYARVSLKGSEQLALKFPDAPGIACMAGARTRLTVVDVDARGQEGERLLADVERQYGRPKAIVRTGREGFHAYYRHNGEARRIKPDRNVPIDILGSGIVVLPPSRGLIRDYEYVEGSIDDLTNLTTMRRPCVPPIVSAAADQIIVEGKRNQTLWQHCMRSAHYCDDFDALLDVARTRNDEFLPPLDDEEVMKIARSAWGYTERGENRFGQAGAWFPVAEVNSLIRSNRDALFLLMFLRANNGPQSTFIVANGLKDIFGWSRQRLAKARGWLEQEGYLGKVRDADSFNGPALYRWSSGHKNKGGEC